MTPGDFKQMRYNKIKKQFYRFNTRLFKYLSIIVSTLIDIGKIGSSHLIYQSSEKSSWLPPNGGLALAGLPIKISTSVGRKYLGSTRTIVSPVAVLTPVSSTDPEAPFHSMVMPTKAKDLSTNSRTACVSLVART